MNFPIGKLEEFPSKRMFQLLIRLEILLLVVNMVDDAEDSILCALENSFGPFELLGSRGR